MFSVNEKKINIGIECNNNCIICKNGINRMNFLNNKFLHFNILSKMVESFSEEKVESIILSGGEPTIHKDFFKIINILYKKNIKITLETNGRIFFYKSFCRHISKYDMNFIVSFFGHNSKIHDYITRVNGSFYQTIQGIKNINLFSKVKIRIVISELNYKYLKEMMKELSKNDIEDVEFIFINPIGNALINFDEVVPKMKDVASHLYELINTKSNYSFNFIISGIPYCILKKHINKNCYISNYNENMIKIEKCRMCIYSNICHGIYETYLSRKGDSEIKPIF